MAVGEVGPVITAYEHVKGRRGEGGFTAARKTLVTYRTKNERAAFAQAVARRLLIAESQEKYNRLRSSVIAELNEFYGDEG